MKTKNYLLGTMLGISFGIIALLNQGCGPVPEPDEKCCSEAYPQIDTVEGVQFIASSTLAQGEYDVAFHFRDWCEHNLNNDFACNQDIMDTSECHCVLHMDTISFQGIDPSFQNQNVDILLRIPKKEGGWDNYPQTIFLDENSLDSLLGQKIIQNSFLHVNFPDEMSDPLGVIMNVGGVCIVENIDGGDDPVPVKEWWQFWL